jgi:hypothetical protein
LRSCLFRCALVLLVGSLLAGCQPATNKSGSLFPYQQVTINEAPAELQAAANGMGMVPGLYVLTTEAETYLLVEAGKVEQSGMKLVVTDVRNKDRRSLRRAPVSVKIWTPATPNHAGLLSTL